MAVTVSAPCKINLGLHVLRKRLDGFRDIDTVLLRIPWSDAVTWNPAPDRSMSCSDPELPTDNANLCFAAAVILADKMDPGRGFRLHLEKRVPYGAGLGSGSSDAAAVLSLLLGEWGIADSQAPDLHALASRLGSDVPFFLGPSPARGTGRGNLLSAMDGWVCPFPLVVAVPPVLVSTRLAYQMIRPSAAGRPDIGDVVRSDDPDRWCAELVNDFEEPVSAAHPAVASTLAALREEGARYAALSGSGSAAFGVCDSVADAAAIAQEMAHRGCRTWHGFAGDPDGGERDPDGHSRDPSTGPN